MKMPHFLHSILHIRAFHHIFAGVVSMLCQTASRPKLGNVNVNPIVYRAMTMTYSLTEPRNGLTHFLHSFSQEDDDRAV